MMGKNRKRTFIRMGLIAGLAVVLGSVLLSKISNKEAEDAGVYSGDSNLVYMPDFQMKKWATLNQTPRSVLDPQEDEENVWIDTENERLYYMGNGFSYEEERAGELYSVEYASLKLKKIKEKKSRIDEWFSSFNEKNKNAVKMIGKDVKESSICLVEEGCMYITIGGDLFYSDGEDAVCIGEKVESYIVCDTGEIMYATKEGEEGEVKLNFVDFKDLEHSSQIDKEYDSIIYWGNNGKYVAVCTDWFYEGFEEGETVDIYESNGKKTEIFDRFTEYYTFPTECKTSSEKIKTAYLIIDEYNRDSCESLYGIKNGKLEKITDKYKFLTTNMANGVLYREEENYCYIDPTIDEPIYFSAEIGERIATSTTSKQSEIFGSYVVGDMFYMYGVNHNTLWGGIIEGNSLNKLSKIDENVAYVRPDSKNEKLYYYRNIVWENENERAEDDSERLRNALDLYYNETYAIPKNETGDFCCCDGEKIQVMLEDILLESATVYEDGVIVGIRIDDQIPGISKVMISSGKNIFSVTDEYAEDNYWRTSDGKIIIKEGAYISPDGERVSLGSCVIDPEKGKTEGYLFGFEKFYPIHPYKEIRTADKEYFDELLNGDSFTYRGYL